MVVLAERLGAWLVASVLFMLGVCWMTYHLTHVTALKPRVTRHCAASLGRLSEIIRTCRVNHIPWVILTGERQRISDISTFFHIVDYPTPQFAVFFQEADVTNAEKTLLGPRQCDANSIFGLKEPDFAFLVASNEGQQNDVVFFALEVVHRADSHSSEEIFGHFFLELD